jgi:hypothetical protein
MAAGIKQQFKHKKEMEEKEEENTLEDRIYKNPKASFKDKNYDHSNEKL